MSAIAAIRRFEGFPDGEEYNVEMADFVAPTYPPERLRAASAALRANDLALNDETREFFKIAHNWRSSHLYPMSRVRHELGGKVRSLAPVGGTTASRLKRMGSIRKKLRVIKHSLYSIQDIAGCRAILTAMSDVDAVVGAYAAGASRHKLANRMDYIERPKLSGYRCQHLVLEFIAREPKEVPFNKHSIELQIRTRLQHSWATAVEAVGLVRREDLKGGKGDPDWLRFFQLMSSQFAVEEGKPIVPGTPQNADERREELRAIEQRLNAIETLDSYNAVIDELSCYETSQKYFVVQFDYASRTLVIKPFHRNTSGDETYIWEEMHHQDRNTVLVEVDKVGDLKDAYPNYFLDVKMFTDRLRGLLSPFGDLSWVKSF